MNPLNTQQSSSTQYFITTGMPTLAPPATSNSILKSTSSSTTPSIPQTASVVTTFSEGNNLMDTKFLTPTTVATNYVPVLLTNQTLISSVDPMHQQFQQHHQQKITPTIINVSNTPVVTGTSSGTTTQMNFIQSSNKPMIMPPSNTGNITYQVLTTTPQNNTMTPMIATPNGSVSVLLTSPQTMATAGHVAAPIIIRNTPTANVAPTTTAAGVQFKSQQQQQLSAMQHQQLQQHQKLQQLHSFNPQNLNVEILKQIIIGNPNDSGTGTSVGTTTLAPGATLLKTSLLQNKPVIQQQQKLQPIQQQKQQQKQQQQIQSNAIVKNKLISIAPQQQKQQQQHHHQLGNQTKIVNSDNSSKMFASIGMELVNTPSVAHTNPNLFTQNVQKLPQVSLLQNSTKCTEIIDDNKTVLKNANEINVGNLNSEVSFIKKPNLAMEKSKETSLLKSATKPQTEKLDSSLLKSVATDKKEQLQQNVKSMKLINENVNSIGASRSKTSFKSSSPSQSSTAIQESSSLLKSNKDSTKTLDKKSENTLIFCNKIEHENDLGEKQQESLLKLNSKDTNDTLAQQQSQLLTSPRSQRSKSCNTLLKTQAMAVINNAANERRYSEPIQKEQCTSLKTSDLKKFTTESKQEIDSLKSDELETLLEEFEDEEYLESSGDKSDTASVGKPQDLETKTPPEKKAKKVKGTKEVKTTEEVKETEQVKETKKVNETDKITSNKSYNDEQQQNIEIIKSNKTVVEEKKEDNYEMLTDKKHKSSESDEDDDVTILPMEEVEIEQIEIDDDDEEEEPMQQNDKSPSTREKETLNESLLCDEQVLVSSSSSISNHSSDQISASSSSIKSPKLEKSSSSSAPLLMKSLMEQKPFLLPPKENTSTNGGYSTVLEMLSNFKMLNWRERVGSARGTKLKFQLNEFNLIQLYEKGPAQKRRIHTAYEKPIYERESTHTRQENAEAPIYYNCRRCNVQGPAVDFLAPEFCSLSCIKRDCRKRQRDDNAACILRKRTRYLPQQQQQNSTNQINHPPPLTYINPPKFRWSNYLKSHFTSIAAPISLFLNPFPTGPNNFLVGMKLEAIDPENCSLFCVCTIIDIMGYRLKLSFDGYDSSYDFWLNADSMDIFPPGWCAKTNRILQPPKCIPANKFTWSTYLNKEKALAAPRQLFTHLNSSSLIPRNPFKIGMHLEAEDLNDTGKLCVASIADVLDDRIRIHFDGWDDCYDIIVDINSPYIHPCGWHEGRQQLVVPPDCENTAFNWPDYIIKQATGEAAGEEIFAPRDPIHFKPNMKLEVVDPRNPSLIRPATVVSHKGHRVKLHLDGWPNDYCFWLEDDSPDLHPIGWCDATGHDLEPPPGFQISKQKMPCPVTGCRGIGNSKKPFMSVHASRDCCPYAAENWRIVMERPPRLGFDNISRTLPKQSRLIAQSQTQHRLSEQQILERLQMLDSIKTRNVFLQQEKLPSNHNDFLGFPLSNVKKEETRAFRQSSSNSTSSSTKKAIPSPNKDSDDSLDVSLDIAKEFLCDYGPRLQQSYTLWQNNFTFDAEKIKRNPLKWSTTEVSVFVDLYLNCRKTATFFSQEDIDGQALLLLQQEDLTDKLGMKLGPAVKLYTCILQLRTLAVTKFDVPYTKSVRN